MQEGLVSSQGDFKASFVTSTKMRASEPDPDGISEEILSKLTPRQTQALRYFVRGFSFDKIEEVMSAGAKPIDVSTVRGFFKEIYKRLDVKSQEQLMFYIVGPVNAEGFRRFCEHFKLSKGESEALQMILKGDTQGQAARDLETTVVGITCRIKEIRRKTGMGTQTASMFYFVHDWVAKNGVSNAPSAQTINATSHSAPMQSP